MTVTDAPLLETVGLEKRYGGLLAVSGLDFQIRSGTITGVIGPNGAGKSTLIGLIGGAIAPTAGRVRLDGADVSDLGAPERARAGIGRTYQIPRPFLDMTVGENLEVAQYSMTPFISAATARRERDEVLYRTGLADVAQAPARTLPLLRRKRLEVARALALKPRLLLLDEVGAGLIDSEITELITLIQSVADDRTAIVIVEHVIRVVRECCSELMVLNFGRKLIAGPTAEILANDEVITVYLGTGGTRGHSAQDGNTATPSDNEAVHLVEPEQERAVLSALIAPDLPTAPGKPLLHLDAICAGYGQARVLEGVDLTVEAGQAIAILGANGAGKTTLARVLSGALKPTSGQLRVDGQDVSRSAPHRIASLGIAHCMEGRRIFPTLSVQENLLIAARSVPAAEARHRLDAVYDLFPVLFERKNDGGTSMSGGQQQMLAIGRALMARPRLVIFDEISLGLAPVIMDRLYEALALLKKQRMTLVIIEQDIDRALALVDYAYVLEHGKFGLSGRPDEVISNPRLRHIYVGAAN